MHSIDPRARLLLSCQFLLLPQLFCSLLLLMAELKQLLQVA